MKKIISMLLAVVMVLGILPVTAFADTSDMNVIEPDSWYSILLPQNASDELQNAAEELNFFLDEITGITLPVVTDDGSMTADGCYVSLGDTSVFFESGYSADGLEAEASVVKTYSDSILLYGGSDVGVTYAMYELLEHWFGLKFYTPDCYTYNAKETVAFEELNLTSTPAVDHRTVAQYLTWYSGWTNLRRMRVSNIEENMNILGHSISQLLPPATYYSAHPEWYSDYTEGEGANWQVCLSNAEMRAQLVANVKAKLAENSNVKYFAIGQNDGAGFCTCDNCKTLNLQYSSKDTNYAGAWLAMVNEVANACAEEYPDVIFYMMAYTQYTDLAPEKGITAASNVGVMIAPVSAQRTDSYFGNSGTGEWDNGRVTTSINGWNAICDHLMMWGYTSQFGDPMVPLNIYDSLDANAQGYAQNNFEVVFEQGISSVLPNFNTMRTYLITKALYDGNIDTFAEAENFINVYYGPAASAMNDYFDSFLTNLRAFEAKGSNYKSFVAAEYLNGDWAYSPAIITDNYSKSYVDTCAGYFDTAYAALADAYGTDSAEYATYKKRLDLEYLGVLYLYLELYADQLTQEQGAQMAQDVFRIVDEQSVVAIKNEQINGWRTQFGVVPDGVDYTFFEVANKDRDCAFNSYSGTVGGKNIDGIRVTSYAYQPHFKFTEEGVALIKAYAEANGLDMLKISAYANLYNNAFVVNNQEWIYAAWESVDVAVSDLTADFDFWSQSEGATEIYMTFEFYKSPTIGTTSFNGSNFSFANYEGTIADVTFSGIKATSSAYQPSFTFSETGIAKIQAYAQENGFHTLAIYTYSEVYNNNVQVGGSGTQNKMWMLSYADIETLSTSYTFKSTSEGATTIYLRFEFVDAPVIDKTSFSGTGYKIYGYGGVVGGEQITGIFATSGNYQPSFYFTADAITAIQAYAAENDYNTLTIHSYADLYNNGFKLGDTYTKQDAWYATDFDIASLSTSLRFLSQSEGTTNVYMWFEFSKQGAITTSSFNGSNFAFENYEGTIANVTFSGIKATSSAYQPSFTFSETGIAKIQAYAQENGFDTLAIYTYSEVYNNLVQVGGGSTENKMWMLSYADIETLSTGYTFKSLCEGATTVYLRFEFVNKPVIDMTSFSGSGYKTRGFGGVVGGEQISGVYAFSSSYQPSFYFTEAAITAIKAYAAENDYNTLTIHSYADLYNNGFKLGDTYTKQDAWYATDFDIDSLSTSLRFLSQSEGYTNVYMWFEFSKQKEITTASFNGSNFTFADYEGTVADVTFTGFKATSNAYQPSFTFSEDGIAKIKAYAQKNGFDTLAIYTYSEVFNNNVQVGGAGTQNKMWMVSYADIATLSTSYTFKSTSEGATTIYLRFEFVDAPVIDKTSFSGTGYKIYGYGGVVGGEQIDGIFATSGNYQPSFYFTEAAITAIKAYAAENDYNTLTIHSYADLYNNGFKLGDTYTNQDAWYATEFPISALSTSLRFLSQSEGATNVYMWFEFSKQPTITTSSFNGSNFAFENYEGTIADVTFTGFKATSSAYQPSFTFSETGIAKIKAYAQENGFDTLAIYTYSEVYNNNVQVGGSGTQNKMWMVSYADIATLSTSYTFKSTSEGATTIYLRFEFVNAPVVDKTSFSGTGYKIYGYGGVVGGEQINGIFATSGNYQPSFYFTADAITAIQAYAAENDYNTLTIHSYADLYNNGFKLGDTYTKQDAWHATDFDIASLSTSLRFLSQSEGTTNVYMWFEFSHVCKYGDWVVTTPATLTTAGERQKTCSCGDVITEVIPCLAGDVESWGLTLGGDLSVNFMISIHEDIRATAKVVITVNGVPTEYDVAGMTPNADNGFYYVSVNVAAAQMNDTITVQIVNGEDASVTKEYTVAQYAQIILANEDYSAYHAIVKEMLNYGAAAQTYFNYNAGNLANAGIIGAGAVDIPADAAADMAVSGKVDGISFYGASLLFRNKIAVRYYFTVNSNIADYTFTVNGVEYEPVLKDGQYYIEVADINPQDLDDVITVIVNDTLSVSYSPMNYIVRMSTKGSENLQALMKALYNYHLAAENLIPDAQ